MGLPIGIVGAEVFIPPGAGADDALFKLEVALVATETGEVGADPGFNPMPLVVAAENPMPVPPVNPVLAGLEQAMAPSVFVETGVITVTVPIGSAMVL